MKIGGLHWQHHWTSSIQSLPPSISCFHFQDNTPYVTKGEAAVRARLGELNRAVREVNDMRRLSLSSASSLAHTTSGRTSSLPADHHHITPTSSEHHPDVMRTPSDGADSAAMGASTHGLSAVEQLHALASMSAASAAPGHAGNMASPPFGHQGAGSLGQDRLLVIRAPIAALTEYSATATAGAVGVAGSSTGTGGDLGPLKFHLLDTPGPNEAGEEELKWQVRGRASRYIKLSYR
jgi:hypothetical protein